MASGPNRPANISGSSDLLHVANQLFREVHNRITQVEKTIPSVIQSETPVSFGSVGANSTVERTVNLLNITSNGVPSVSPKASLGATPFIWSAYIPKANQLVIRIFNPSGAPATPNTVPWNIVVSQK